ncbi:MAG TPA: helix-turn-helix transcriptional regulator [Blastocatellia bacterium]|nr:helix-turn-helix transcriptional regulator [Blastocatellia bacterium]
MLAQRSYASVPLAAPPSEGRDRLDSLAAALDEISEGAVFMNSEGQLIWHNRAFDKLLVDNREGHLLVAAVIESGADFYQSSYESRGVASERTSVRDTTVGRIEHEIHCTLMPQGMLGEESYVLCLVKRSASRWSSYEEHLRQTWGLTEREAQVAVECLKGNKNLEIAQSLRISVETVNKHLDKVYQKANVRGRSELASRLLDSGL